MGSEMKKMISVVTLIAIMILSVAMFPISAVVGQEAGNQVTIYLDHEYSYGTYGDTVENTYLACGSWWRFYMYNDYDSTGEAIINPNLTVVSNLTFERFSGSAWGVLYDPFTPNVTSPPVYEWYWNRNLGEGEHINITALEHGAESFKPGFSLSRSVTLSTIILPIVLQVVKVTFRLEEPLPENTSGAGIGILAWTTEEAKPNLVRVFPTPDHIDKGSDYTNIWWWPSVEELVLWKTYTFIAIFLTAKLVRGPIEYKPFVCAGYTSSPGYRLYGTGKSVTLTNPNITVTYSNENELEWYTNALRIIRSVNLWCISGTKAIKTENPLMCIKH